MCERQFFVSPVQVHEGICARIETRRYTLGAARGQALAPTIGCEAAVHRLREATALHDAEELVLVDLAITITVGLVNHLLELLVGHVLTELLGNTLQVLEANLAGLVIVEEAEHLDDLLAGVTVAHASGHHVEEL